MRILDDLVERTDHDSSRALEDLIKHPVHQGCLGLLTTFHGFTRYALLDELLDPDRDEEVRFGATLFALQQIVMADYPDMRPVETENHHRHEFLPRVADAYWDLFAGLAHFFADVLSATVEIMWIGDVVRGQIDGDA